MPESFCTRAAHEARLRPSDLERLVGVARSAADAGGQELMRHYGRLSSICLLYTSPSPRDLSTSRMPSSA